MFLDIMEGTILLCLFSPFCVMHSKLASEDPQTQSERNLVVEDWPVSLGSRSVTATPHNLPFRAWERAMGQPLNYVPAPKHAVATVKHHQPTLSRASKPAPRLTAGEQ